MRWLLFLALLLTLGCAAASDPVAPSTSRAHIRPTTEALLATWAATYPTPTLGFRDWSAQKQAAKLREQGLYTPPPRMKTPTATSYPPTPIPFSHSDFRLCRQFREEMAFARSKGWTFENLDALLTAEELAEAIEMNGRCNRVMNSAYPTSTPAY